MELNQIIKTPTRVTDNTKTLIDHIYVNNDLPVLQSAPINYSISDHFLVFSVLNLKNNSKQVRYVIKLTNKCHTELTKHSILMLQ